MKHLNFGYLLEQEKKVSDITSSSYKKPLALVDENTKFFMALLEFVHKVNLKTKDKQIKNYTMFYLTMGNAIIHLIRVSRYSIITGYYGNAMVLMRTIINYLNMSIYVRHHPEDAELLLEEKKESFKENKIYKKKFHEFNIKRKLNQLGYRIPEEYDDIAKTTHGSLWGSQVFGFKGFETPEEEFEIQFSPKFSMTQCTTYLSFIISVPTDFSVYCMQYLSEKGVKIDKELADEYNDLQRRVRHAIFVMESSYQFIKNTPEDIQQALIKKIEQEKKQNT